MTFGEKLKQLREQRGLTQAQLAKDLKLSLKTISNYEVKNVRPRTLDLFQTIANYFQVDVNYLLSHKDIFVLDAKDRYGQVGARQAQDLLSSMEGLFAGGKLPQEDKDALFEAIQEAYWKAKLNNKKYGSKQ